MSISQTYHALLTARLQKHGSPWLSRQRNKHRDWNMHRNICNSFRHNWRMVTMYIHYTQ